MPDFFSTMISAGSKPLVKIVLTFRPSKMRKRAEAAEQEITRLLFGGTALLPEKEFVELQHGRAETDLARLEAKASSWRKSGVRHVVITYEYYARATKLLGETQIITTKALRLYGPEGQRAARMSIPTASTPDGIEMQPLSVASGTVVSYTLDNVLLKPGDNLVRLPFPLNAPQLATIEVRVRPVDAGPVEGGSSVSDRDDALDEHESISVTISTASDDDTVEGDQYQGEDDDKGDTISIEASFNLAKRAGKQRWVPLQNAGPSTSVEIDLSDLGFGYGDDS